MIDTQSIRTKILDLAMRGQLTEQLPEDGTAEELYQQIQEEKLALIKAGKIKKEKPLPEITEGEMPFEIPESWKWVRLGKAITLVSGTDYKPEEYNAENRGVPYITGASNLLAEGVLINRWTENPRCIANYGDVLLVCKGSGYGKVAMCDIEVAHIARQIMAIKKIDSLVMEYVLYFLMANFDYLKSKGQGLIPGVDRQNVLNMQFPLPSLTEQQRIVDRVQQAFTALDAIDELQKQYANNLTVLKSKLIDAAIQGKLTEQLPEDGTAEELYQQIQEEKQALIRAGKIKKEKPLPEIAENEIPFEIPGNWKWVRFSDLYSLSNGIASRGTQGGKPYPVLRLADLTSGIINTDNIRNIDLLDDEFSTHKVQSGDLIFIRVNGSRDKVANAFLYTDEQDVSYCDHLFCGHKTSSLFDAGYVIIVYQSNMAKAQLDPEIKTTAGQNTISQKSMAKILIPLPPLAEQKRIVARLDQVLATIKV